MYQSSETFGNLILQDSRTFKSLITYDDITITNAKSIKLTGGSESGNDFSLGSAMSQYITVTIPDPGKPVEGHELLLQIGIEMGGLVEYIPMGYFTPEKPSKNEEQLTFTAYDRMIKTETPFSIEGDSTDTVSVLKRIQEITGVPVITDGLTGISMSSPKGYSCRETLSYVAQLYGCFTVCNRKGQIELRKYADGDYKVGTGRYWDTFEHNDYLFKAEKLTCYTGKDKDGKDVFISSGDGTRAVSFFNPFMTQDTLDKVLNSFKGFSYMPGSLRMLGDPRLDPWDVLTVEDRSGKSYKVPLMKLSWEYDGGFTNSVEAVGLSEKETNANSTGPNTKEMERYYAELVMINHAMINKLDVDTAKITYATIQNLDVVHEYVQKIDGELGNFKDLTAVNFSATNARINILENDYGNIKVLLSGNAGIGNLQNIHLTSQNAVIESALIKNAVMQTVSIGDLLTGTISTNKFMIASDDGGIRIQGATQQWRDSDGIVRMQVGMDATGNFTFALFDKTGEGILLDATGVKPGAVAKGLIVDDMVGDSANINAKKLDVESFFSVINGSSQTIKSSRIWLDEENQTLNQSYSLMKKELDSTGTQVATVSSGLSGLRAELQQMDSDNQGQFKSLTTSLTFVQGNISALISDSEIIKLKNGETTMYSRLVSMETSVNSLQLLFSDMSSKYDTVTGQYNSLDSKMAMYEAGLEGVSADITKISQNLSENYSTTSAMNASISASLEGFSASISKAYATKSELDTESGRITNLETWKSEASLKITDAAIVSTVTSSSSWNNKADKTKIISQINQSSESISISASKIKLEGVVTANNYFKIDTDGSMQCIGGRIGGWSIQKSYLQSPNGALTLWSTGKIVFMGEHGAITFADTGIDHLYTTAECYAYGTWYFDKEVTFQAACSAAKQWTFSTAPKLYNLSYYSTGGHIVFAKDGATLAWASSSSKRYKEHLRNLEEDDLTRLWELPVVWFKYKAGYLASDDRMVGKPVPGFYAEDMEKYIPEAVRYNDRNEPEDWEVRYLIPYLTRALQECHREIEALKRKAG